MHIELFAVCPARNYKKQRKKPGTRQKRNVILFEATEREWRLDRETENREEIIENSVSRFSKGKSSYLLSDLSEKNWQVSAKVRRQLV